MMQSQIQNIETTLKFDGAKKRIYVLRKFQ